jgi:hypothetical protein
MILFAHSIVICDSISHVVSQLKFGRSSSDTSVSFASLMYVAEINALSIHAIFDHDEIALADLISVKYAERSSKC